MNLFKQKRRQKIAIAGEAKVFYDPTLVERLKAQHLSLLEKGEAIQTAAATSDYPRIASLLESFRRVLRRHLSEENLHLYSYLLKSLSGDSDGAELVASVAWEMMEIDHRVLLFVDHYDEFGVNEHNVRKFKADLEKLRTLLHDRMQREEESLFTLYLPEDNYSLDY